MVRIRITAEAFASSDSITALISARTSASRLPWSSRTPASLKRPSTSATADNFEFLATEADHLAYEIVDLQGWHLPFGDEPGIPAQGVYGHDHTRAWSAKVAAADGFIFVTPQYNWGYPAPLKNARDHLYPVTTHIRNGAESR
jgi:NAD(P)H-dependent FMN reductase